MATLGAAGGFGAAWAGAAWGAAWAGAAWGAAGGDEGGFPPPAGCPALRDALVGFGALLPPAGWAAAGPG